MSAYFLHLFKSFPEWKVIEMFKYVEHYWDCCIVGYVMNHIFNGVLGGVLFMLIEVIKFSIVLVLTYALAIFIFYIWERNIANDGMTATPQRQSIIRTNANSTGKYPFVVEIPSKSSWESEAQPRRSKTREKDLSKMDFSKTSLESTPAAIVEGQATKNSG